MTDAVRRSLRALDDAALEAALLDLGTAIAVPAAPDLAAAVGAAPVEDRGGRLRRLVTFGAEDGPARRQGRALESVDERRADAGVDRRAPGRVGLPALLAGVGAGVESGVGDRDEEVAALR